MNFAVPALVVISLLSFQGTLAMAETPGLAARPEAERAAAPQKDRKKKASAAARNSKDTEGSEAPNRFEAETIIRSQYTLDGKPLEVDTD